MKALGCSGIWPEVSYDKAMQAPMVVIGECGRSSTIFENFGGGYNSGDVETSTDLHAEGGGGRYGFQEKLLFYVEGKSFRWKVCSCLSRRDMASFNRVDLWN